ncbi:MAG: LON peptidase substrate-binding domain-containing protein [Oceanobacter sp.]
MTSICLFPIPDCVSFPGTVFPLHVFEPRYRDMMYHCLEHKIPVAICHTRKTLSHRKGEQTREQALQSNQDTYQPFDVFSAGELELLEITNDGRMYLNVHLQNRYRSVAEVQCIPYLIHECELFSDRPLNEADQQESQALQEKIVHRLDALAYRHPTLKASFDAERWSEKTVEEFSMQLFGMVSFGSSVQQNLLEMDSPLERLELALSLLNQAE